MDIHKLFDDDSDIYVKARPRYPTPLYQWLVNTCPQRQVVWDVGCGNGQAAIDLKEYFNLVEATDVSPSQIENAPDCEGVNFSIQPAESTNFNDSKFDAVCVAQALHWFDYEKFWPELQRVLKPNGVFTAWGYSWPHIAPSIDETLKKSFLSVIKPYWANQNKLLWNGYQDVPFPLTPIDAPDIELSMDWSVEQFFTYLHSWSATRQCIDVEGDHFFQESFQKISDLWGDDTKRSISMDFVLIAGRNTI